MSLLPCLEAALDGAGRDLVQIGADSSRATGGPAPGPAEHDHVLDGGQLSNKDVLGCCLRKCVLPASF